MLVCVPLSGDDLAALAGGAVLTEAVGFAATPAFCEAFGLGPGDDEDAERTLLYLAGLAALQRHGRRLVAVADVPVQPLDDTLGGVRLARLGFGSVTALFADDEAGRATAGDARAALAGLDVEAAWDHLAHEALLEQADLAWYGPEEWSHLTGGAG